MNVSPLDFKKDLIALMINYFDEAQIEVLKSDTFARQYYLIEMSELNTDDKMQLEIDLSPTQNRYNIDRIVTHAQKKLRDTKYFNFLTNLSEICLTHGEFKLTNELILKIKRESRLKEITASSLLILSDLYSRRAKWKRSLSSARRASKLFSKTNDYLGMARSENIIGTIFGDQGKLREAKEHFERSLSLLGGKSDESLVTMLKVNLGITHNIIGEYEEADEYFTSSLEILEKNNDIRRIAEVRYNMGIMYKEQKYFHSALSEFDKSINIARENNFKPILAVSYLSKADIFISLEEYGFALAFANKAMDVSHEIEDKLTIAEVYKLKGILERIRGNNKLSENYFLSALRINQKLGIQINIAECSLEIANLYNQMSKEEEENEFLSKSLRYYKKVNVVENIEEIEDRLKNIDIS